MKSKMAFLRKIYSYKIILSANADTDSMYQLRTLLVRTATLGAEYPSELPQLSVQACPFRPRMRMAITGNMRESPHPIPSYFVHLNIVIGCNLDIT